MQERGVALKILSEQFVVQDESSPVQNIKNSELISSLLPFITPVLRNYQIDACKYAIAALIRTKDPIMLQLATGAGKSWIIVGVAFLLKRIVQTKSKKTKKILVLCPSPKLVEQNAEKFLEIGVGVSIYCDTLLSKDTSHDIIIGTPHSVVNAGDQFYENEFTAIFLDECQNSHTPMVKTIVYRLKQFNENLRELGLTATPHRTKTGYIYKYDAYNDIVLTPEYASEPYYAEKVYEIKAPALIEQGYLLPPKFTHIDDNLIYQISGLKMVNGRYTVESETKVFVDGKHQQTSLIVGDIKEKTKERKSVLIFAQNINHANILYEIMKDDSCGITHSNINDKIRDDAIDAFKARKLKYLINVQSLTTGFDAPNIDAIAILRLTQSAALYEQIVGRGLRLDLDEPGTIDCLILDYCCNLKKHCPDGDPFSPMIEARIPNGSSFNRSTIDVVCPTCNHQNTFLAIASLPIGSKVNEYGYLVSELTEEYLMTRSEYPSHFPGHYGAQCSNYIFDEATKKHQRCKHTWSKNYCNFCGHLNSNYETHCVKCMAPVSLSADFMVYATKTKLEEIKGNDEKYEQEILSVASDNYYGFRAANFIDIRWSFKKTKKGALSILLEAKVKQLPFITKCFGQVFAEDPEPEKLTFWLSPEFNHHSAKLQWRVFSDFFWGRNDLSISEYKKMPVIKTAVSLVYKKSSSSTENTSFFELVRLL